MEKFNKIKEALPELKEEYKKVDELFDDAFSRVYHNASLTYFDRKYMSLAPMLLQTIGFLIDSLDE